MNTCNTQARKTLDLVATTSFSDLDSIISAFANSEYIALAGHKDGKVHVLNANGEHLVTVQSHEKGAWRLMIVDDILVTGGYDGDIQLWDIQSGEKSATLKGHDTTPTAFARVYPDGLVSGDYDGVLHLWDVVSRTRLRTFFARGGDGVKDPAAGPIGIRDVCVEDGVCVSVSSDATVRVWSVRTAECLHVLRGHTSEVMHLLVSRGRAVTGSLDGTARVWDISQGTCLAVLEGHVKPCNNLRLHNGDLVTTGVDGFVRVWSLDTYEQVRAVKVHEKAATGLQIYGDLVITAGKEGGAPESGCGLNFRVVTWSLNEDVPELKQLGTVAVCVYKLLKCGDSLVVLCAKKGVDVVEVWRCGGTGS